ncbi:MAG: hypothetical protein UX21_C0012G0002 [Microgenomates group bacterium GW2011_GWC2_45_8]|nr:MAG: hypothetical protein UX21_C0012G0002 [Microgenomates group bacterium GW2011_GWC2_45_8]
MAKCYTNLMVEMPLKLSFPKWPLVALFSFLLGAASVLAYQKLLPTRTVPVDQSTTPSADPTADWKTLQTNSFSIKYPLEWQEPSQYQQSTRTAYDFIPGNLTIVEGSYYDQVLQRPRTYEEELAIAEEGPIGKQEIIVDNSKAIKYTNKIGDSTYEELAILKSSTGMIFWISMPFPPGTDPNLFDLILSTFKFLDDQKTVTGQTCQYNGITYQDGESVPDKCNYCSCESGQIACTLRACQ